MRINYLLLLAGVWLMSGLCFSQNVFITNNAPVKVEENTLVYFGQNLSLNSDAENGDGTAVVTNAGNIKIDGEFFNASSTGDNIVNTWTDNTNYGQIIIRDQNNTSGRLSMEKGVINPSSFSWGQFSIPFVFNNANDAMLGLFGVPYVNGANRYMASMMAWDNSVNPEFDHLNNASSISPTDYYILNLTYGSAGILNIMQNNSKLTYRGIPSNGQYNSGLMNTSMYFPGLDWDSWKDMINSHNEKYSSYIDDPVLTTTDFNYGKYVYQFGNPYTSNLNLAYMGTNDGSAHEDGVYLDNLSAVAQLNTASWAYGTGLVSSTMVKATYNSSLNQWAGDAEALIVKPFEPFLVVLNSPVDQSIDFTDGLKTFEMQVGSDVDVGGKPAQTTANDSPVVSQDGNGTAFYQLRFKLYDEEGNETGNRVNIAVSPVVEDEVPNEFEAEYYDFQGSGFYLAQERADGGHVTASERKMDINAINIEFVGKPIPMLFNRVEGDQTSYKIKAELFEGSIFNKLQNENENFSDGNTFYIYDNETDELAEVQNGSVFVIEPIPANGAKNRYEVYWNEGPSGKGLGTNDQLASATIIYKDKDSHFVKFNDQWAFAEVKVYDMSGRNILTYEKVDTKNNLEIKLASRGVYVVKIKSNTGEVYTQKIIK
ncbi:MAG: T9SS type A sorting domain-containing protein [Weeksellaceae bacterium]|jgi:hypothetical protein|nr:T9SS type A sorting domain-containing protein [Weeksellaceae bacterium]